MKGEEEKQGLLPMYEGSILLCLMLERSGEICGRTQPLPQTRWMTFGATRLARAQTGGCAGLAGTCPLR
eukprot:713280-Hanusia_phi.AAC.1